MTKLTDEQKAGPWTQFWDMHSGGGSKLDWEKIYIQAERDAAIEIFKKTFGRDPENVTCDCCGGDYSINEDKEWGEARPIGLAYLSAYQRNSHHETIADGLPEVYDQCGDYENRRLIPLEEYVDMPGVKVLFKRMVLKEVPEYGELTPQKEGLVCFL